MKIRFLLITLCVGVSFSLHSADRPGGFRRRRPGANIHGLNGPLQRQQPQNDFERQVRQHLEQTLGRAPQEQEVVAMMLILRREDARVGAPAWQRRLDTVVEAGHNHFASWRYFGLDYLSDILKAVALRVRNPHAMRALYALSFGAKGLNTASSVTSAVAPYSTLVGYTAFDANILLRRTLAGICAINDAADTANGVKMFTRSGILARLYQKKPELRKQLNKTSNKRLINRTIAFGVALAIFGILHTFKRRVTGDIPNWIWASIAYDAVSSLLVDRKSEDPGLEDRLLNQAQQVLNKKKRKKQEEEDELLQLESELLSEESVS